MMGVKLAQIRCEKNGAFSWVIDVVACYNGVGRGRGDCCRLTIKQGAKPHSFASTIDWMFWVRWNEAYKHEVEPSPLLAVRLHKGQSSISLHGARKVLMLDYVQTSGLEDIFR